MSTSASRVLFRWVECGRQQGRSPSPPDIDGNIDRAAPRMQQSGEAHGDTIHSTQGGDVFLVKEPVSKKKDIILYESTEASFI